MLQEDGYGQIVGRVKDVIIRVGDKIFPKEVEDFFMEHPNVLEAQVIKSRVLIGLDKNIFIEQCPVKAIN